MPVLVNFKTMAPSMTALATQERIIYRAPSPDAEQLKARVYSGQTVYVLDTLRVNDNGHEYVFAQLQPTPGSSTPEFIIAEMDGFSFALLKPLTLDPTNMAQIMSMLVSALADLQEALKRLGK